MILPAQLVAAVLIVLTGSPDILLGAVLATFTCWWRWRRLR